MRQAWKCVDAGDGSWDLTKGRLYYCDKDGNVIKDGGVIGAHPEAYNTHRKQNNDRGVPMFAKYQCKLENK